MANKTTGGLLVGAVVIAAVVYLAPEVVGKAGELIADITGAQDAVTVGSGNTAFMVAAETQPTVAACAEGEILNDRQCGGIRVLIVDASRMPFIARNTKLAWESGQPAVLTANRAKSRVNRAQACPPDFPRPHGGQCDEYPMASTDEGGKGARAEEVPARENQCQGPLYRSQYPPNGERFLVVISHPERVAADAFAGTDLARDKGWC